MESGLSSASDDEDNSLLSGTVREFVRNVVRLFQHTFKAWFADNASRQAAALAYYGVLSLAPLLVVAIGIAGFFFGQADVKQQVVQEVQQTLGAGSADLVENVLNATYTGNSGLLATGLSLIIILFASTNIFFQLKTSLNRIWNVESDDDTDLLRDVLSLLGDRLVAAVMVIGVGLLFLLSQVFSTVISIIISIAGNLPVNTSLLLQVLNTMASIGMMAVIISLIFRFLPDKRLNWKDVWLGAVFTAILFAIGQRAISIYLENSSVASVYGVAGSLILILLWIYYSCVIFLFGAEFTQAYASLYGSDADNDGTNSGKAANAS